MQAVNYGDNEHNIPNLRHSVSLARMTTKSKSGHCLPRVFNPDNVGSASYLLIRDKVVCTLIIWHESARIPTE